MKEWTVETSAPEETRALARMLGELIMEPLAVRLSGTLGAGKTCFAQGFALGLDVSPDEPINSPSYTLMNLYQGRFPLYHFDLYRLTHPDDLDDLGYDEYLAGDGVALVEWADRFEADGGRTEGLSISIRVADEETRDIVFRANGSIAEGMLSCLSNSWSGNVIIAE